MRQRGVSCAQAELSVAASGEATGAELPSIWTGRALAVTHWSARS